MKTLRFLLSATFMLLVYGAFSQSYLEDPKYGATPEERKQNVLNYNLFNDAANAKDFDVVLQYLKPLLEKSPKLSENIYIKGAEAYRNKVARATTNDERKAYADSLMMLYDLRVEHFGSQKKAAILVFKSRDFLINYPSDRVRVYKFFDEALDAMGENVDGNIVNIYFQELTNDYKADHLEADIYMNEYEKLASLLDNAPDSPKKEETKKTFESLFINSGAANCENIEKIYKPRIEQSPNDTLMIQKAFKLLVRNNCSNAFTLTLGERYYQLQPSSSTALMLAESFEKSKEYSKAVKYLEGAVDIEKDPIVRANLMVRIAANELGRNNSRAAAEAARQASVINPENAYAYIMLAHAYAGGVRASCSGFDAQAAYWLIYDIMTRARSVANDAELIATIDSQLGNYRGNFPTKEECFYRGLNNGAGYTVNCGWVSGKTTIRER